MKNNSWLQVRIDNITKNKFKKLADANGIDMSGMIRFLILRELKQTKQTASKEAQSWVGTSHKEG